MGTRATHTFTQSSSLYIDSPSIIMAESNPNDAQHELTFESADAGASLTFPMQCSALRKNGFVCIKNRPCKIVDLFTGKKLEDLSPSTHNMDVPNVRRQEYQLVDVSDDGFLNLLTDSGDEKNDVKVPEGDVGDKIKKLFTEEEKDVNVIVLTAMGEEAAIDAKEAPKGS